MLRALPRLWPPGVHGEVLFDRGSASKRWRPCGRRRDWQVLCAIKSGCSRCYLNPLIKVSIYNQWLIISSRQIGIVLNASHDKKLHWGAQRVNT